jgi:hypothetical protein
MKNRVIVKLIAVILAVSLCSSVGARAAGVEAVEPRASAYLMEYSTYICAMGDGELQIWFEVTGTDIQEYLGVLTIYLFESTDRQNWTRVDTFHYPDYPGMLEEYEYFVCNYVPYYEGVPGRYYKAYVTIWGGPDATGDARYVWTPIEICT